MEYLTQVEALTRGLKRYLPVVPCKNGHRTLHYSANNMCCACQAKTMRDYRQRRDNYPVHMKKILIARGDERAIVEYAKLLAAMRGIDLEAVWASK